MPSLVNIMSLLHTAMDVERCRSRKYVSKRNCDFIIRKSREGGLLQYKIMSPNGKTFVQITRDDKFAQIFASSMRTERQMSRSDNVAQT